MGRQFSVNVAYTSVDEEKTEHQDPREDVKANQNGDEDAERKTKR